MWVGWLYLNIYRFRTRNVVQGVMVRNGFVASGWWIRPVLQSSLHYYLKLRCTKNSKS